MTGIFVSYRRTDTDVAAGRLAGDLAEIFGPGAIVRDVDSLVTGEDYVEAINRALASCQGERGSTRHTLTGFGLRRHYFSVAAPSG